MHEERSASNQAAIDRVNAELAELEARLAGARREEMSLLDEVSLLDQELARASGREKAARLMALEEARRARVARERATALSQRLVVTRARVALVLEAMYRSSPAEGVAALLLPAPTPPSAAGPGASGGESSSPGSADAGGSLLARRQVELAAEIQHAVQAARQAEFEAKQRAASAERLAESARERAGEARTARADRRRRLGALAADRVRAEQLEEERGLAEAGLLQDVAMLSRPAPAGTPRAVAPRTDLAGLDALRGHLPWPTETRGKLRGSFGDVVNPRHGTRTLRHGIVLELPEGSPIRAIAPGRVVFADWFKGFGRCLVIDHGGGWMSVQAHARAFEVRQGDDVVTGQLVGEVGDSGSLEGPRLYFQLSEGAEPVNPLLWLED